MTVPEPTGVTTWRSAACSSGAWVEDKDINRAVALRHPRALCYRAAAARHGAEAVEKFARRPCRRAMNCQMAVMDATRRRPAPRRGKPHRPLRSWHDRGRWPGTASAACRGDGRYISKPVAFEDLATALRRRWGACVRSGGGGGGGTSYPIAVSTRRARAGELRALDTPVSGFLQAYRPVPVHRAPASRRPRPPPPRRETPTAWPRWPTLRSIAATWARRACHDLGVQIEEKADQGTAVLARSSAPLLEDMGGCAPSSRPSSAAPARVRRAWALNAIITRSQARFAVALRSALTSSLHRPLRHRRRVAADSSRSSTSTTRAPATSSRCSCSSTGRLAFHRRDGDRWRTAATSSRGRASL